MDVRRDQAIPSVAEAILKALPLPALLLGERGEVLGANRLWQMGGPAKAPEPGVLEPAVRRALQQGEPVLLEQPRVQITPLEAPGLAVAVFAEAPQPPAWPGERYARAEQAAGAFAYAWELCEGRLHYSPNLAQVTGYAPEELPPGPEGWYALIHPDDLGPVRKRLEARGPFALEYRLRHKDGRYRWLLDRGEVRRGAEGPALGVVGYCLDVSAAKEAQQFLERTRRQVIQVLDSVGDAFFVLDTAWRFTYLNRAAERLLGRKCPQLIGKNLWEEFPHLRQTAIYQNFLWARDSGGSVAFEALYMPLRRWFEVRAYPDPQGLAAYFHDIHDRKEAEEALRISEERYRELSESQKRFVNDAAHELRAPLTAIQGNLDLLVEFPQMPEQDRAEALRETHREARRLARLVNDMLALARGDAGRTVHKRWVRLEEVVASAWAKARSLAKGHRLELAPVPPLEIHADPDRLEQLLLILLDNALKYTPPPGRVRLEVEAGQEVRVRVADEGIGIAPEDLPHVFERFWRADPARSRDADGTGLGLSIARWIVEQHGGRVWLESELGRGTTVTVHLPVA
ncbi:ATP-binding protein [Calidithermus chliarophilus]|uniref:ATP-binding protein n=1 Tax=Calidithermus chliarophilus TaxID=52023 RepID=UPI0003FC9888|nr:ATP-binding protein [Calidithermus chliarophilus]